MEPFSSAQLSQMLPRRSWTLLDFFCQIHSSSSMQDLKYVRRRVRMGEFLTEVVAVDDAELLHRVGGGTVGPVGTHLLVGVPHAVLQNVPAVLFEYLVSVAHSAFLLW